MSDQELELRYQGQKARVSSLGASLRSYSAVIDGQEREIVWGYQGAANKLGGQGDVLMPFPGRITQGIYRFEGKTYELARNDKEGPNAIHGFVRTREWSVSRDGEALARFQIELSEKEFAPLGYPFSISIEVSYQLSDSGLRCDFSAKNTGTQPAPFGAGFHPYFTMGTETIDEARALIPASQIVEFGENFVPTGKIVPIEGTPIDFRKLRPIGSTRFNNCLTGLIRGADGIARARLSAKGRWIELWADRAFPYLVVYTGDAIALPHARRAFAIEPMTCGTNAFNHPEWGSIALAPGTTLRGSFGVSGGVSAGAQ